MAIAMMGAACGTRTGADGDTAAAQPAPPAIDVRRAEVIGDSLIVSTADEQLAAVSALGFETVVRALPGVPLSSRFIQQSIDAAVGSGVVVIATASNDNYSNYLESLVSGRPAAQARYREQLRLATERLAGSCVVWVNTRTTIGAYYRPEETRATNTTLADFVASQPEAWLVDWAAISEGHDQRDWFVADNLHFNRFYRDQYGFDVQDDSQRRQLGADAYAAAIADGVSRCPRP